MSKSIKLNNDTYWDTRGIIQNGYNLYDVINSIMSSLSGRCLSVPSRIFGDNNTYTFSTEQHHAYLWINTHIYNREIILLTTYGNTLNADVIWHAGSTQTSFSLSNLVLTISTHDCRGKIIDLHTICA